MVTVLPTPAPPNRPILPPLANGQIRSITLMPVSSSSDRRRQLVELRRRLVDRAALVGLDRTALVDRPAEHVHDAAEHAGAHGHLDVLAGAVHLHAALQAVGAAHRDRAHDAVAELLLHLEREPLLDQLVLGIGLEDQRVVDLRQRLALELHVDDGADALDDGSGAFRLPCWFPCQSRRCHRRQSRWAPLFRAADQPISSYHRHAHLLIPPPPRRRSPRFPS